MELFRCIHKKINGANGWAQQLGYFDGTLEEGYRHPFDHNDVQITERVRLTTSHRSKQDGPFWLVLLEVFQKPADSLSEGWTTTSAS